MADDGHLVMEKPQKTYVSWPNKKVIDISSQFAYQNKLNTVLYQRIHHTPSVMSKYGDSNVTMASS